MSLGTRRSVLAGSLAGAGWVLAGYPLALALLPRRPWRQRDEEPRVALIIPAYRERDGLSNKLVALAGLDYPAERLQVIIAIDEDRALTDVARSFYPSAEITYSPTREGKSASLKRALGLVSADIVVLTDANNVLAPQSVRAAVRHFADPAVWGVAGRRGEAGSAYERYEDIIRRLETRSGSVAAASGEFLAIRRDRLPPIPAGVVNDDFWLLCSLVAAGGRVVYEPEAASMEESVSLAGEYARRSRMGAGRVQSLGGLAGITGMPAGFRARVISHKYGRLALPFLMLGVAASSLSLAGTPRYRRIAALQAVFYALGALGADGRHVPAGPIGRIIRAAGQFLVGNVAVAAGVIRALRGRQPVRWDAVR